MTTIGTILMPMAIAMAAPARTGIRRSMNR